MCGGRGVREGEERERMETGSGAEGGEGCGQV